MSLKFSILFQAQNLRIDVFGDTAIGLYSFRKNYGLETTKHDECGLKFLVLIR